jgi:hypothetical protein
MTAWTADRDDLGTLGWFLGVWVVMMAAMMFPSVSPTVALYSRMTRQRSFLSPLLFTGGYLATWTAAGVFAFLLALAAGRIAGDPLSWDRGGRWVAGATLLVAAVYELTPLKDVCLGKCRSPLGFLLGSWRDGKSGVVRMGMENGAWCVGCCWALMASLFALGIMSLVWMAFVAGLIAVEKVFPWRWAALYGTTAPRRHRRAAVRRPGAARGSSRAPDRCRDVSDVERGDGAEAGADVGAMPAAEPMQTSTAPASDRACPAWGLLDPCACAS